MTPRSAQRLNSATTSCCQTGLRVSMSNWPDWPPSGFWRSGRAVEAPVRPAAGRDAVAGGQAVVQVLHVEKRRDRHALGLGLLDRGEKLLHRAQLRIVAHGDEAVIAPDPQADLVDAVGLGVPGSLGMYL